MTNCKRAITGYNEKRVFKRGRKKWCLKFDLRASSKNWQKIKVAHITSLVNLFIYLVGLMFVFPNIYLGKLNGFKKFFFLYF